MATKTGIGYSPLTGRVFMGKQNPEKQMWIGDKTDITDQFLAVAFEYFKVNTITHVERDNGDVYLVINIMDNRTEWENVIKKLTKRLNTLG